MTSRPWSSTVAAETAVAVTIGTRAIVRPRQSVHTVTKIEDVLHHARLLIVGLFDEK